MKARLRLMIKGKGGDFKILCVPYVFNIRLKSCVEALFHLPYGIKFVMVSRWVNVSGPPCIDIASFVLGHWIHAHLKFRETVFYLRCQSVHKIAEKQVCERGYLSSK